MPEQYANYNALTTVATGGRSSGSATLNVASTTSPLPSSQTFTVVVQDQVTGATDGLLRVTAVNSSTQWNVTPEGTDFNCNAGDKVYYVRSAESEIQIRADISQQGTYANLPSPGSYSGQPGDIYRCTDEPYGFRWNGSAWIAFDSPIILPAFNPSGFGWVNQGSATITATGRDQVIASNQSLSSGGDQFQAYLSGSTPGSSTYTLTIQYALLGVINFQAVSLALKATGSGKLITLSYFNCSALQVEQWTSETSFSSTVFATTSGAYSVPTGSNIYLRIKNDATHRTYYYSTNGADFYEMYSESSGTFITENDYGIGFHLTANNSSSRLMARVRGLSLTNP